MDPKALAVPIFIKYLNKFFGFLFSRLLSKISKKNRIWITQEDKYELTSGLRIATLSVRYALKNHNEKRQLTFRMSRQQIDAGCFADWLYDYFLDFYYATLNKKIKEQIETINDLHNSLSRFYCYSHSFFECTSDSAYSLRYQRIYNNPENIKKGQEIADETFGIILPNLLNAYIELTKLFQNVGIID